ncbi:hypothetical protein LSAT2_029131 [Lamellibrachia satsuma]|nr:hypothetical protein LSAT2_029131 [Lamellibrachia satsuma]
MDAFDAVHSSVVNRHAGKTRSFAWSLENGCKSARCPTPSQTHSIMTASSFATAKANLAGSRQQGCTRRTWLVPVSPTRWIRICLMWPSIYSMLSIHSKPTTTSKTGIASPYAVFTFSVDHTFDILASETMSDIVTNRFHLVKPGVGQVTYPMQPLYNVLDTFISIRIKGSSHFGKLWPVTKKLLILLHGQATVE